jgi:hypothetical protein
MLCSLSLDDSNISSPSSLPSTLPNDILDSAAPFQRKHRSKSSSSSSLYSSTSSSGPGRSRHSSGNLKPLVGMIPEDSERSYGKLDAYPLRRPSSVCKATGGGRWEPKQMPVLVAYRQSTTGGKAPHEILLEQEAEEESMKKENSIIRDGDFQYRFPKQSANECGPGSFQLSTF